MYMWLCVLLLPPKHVAVQGVYPCLTQLYVLPYAPGATLGDVRDSSPNADTSHLKI